MTSDIIQQCDGAVRVALRVTPKASANRIQGVVEDADGKLRLKLQVTTVPEGGKANQAVVKLLAKAWKLPKTSLSVVSGQTDRNKVVEIAGDPALLTEQLSEFFREV
ncbi:DUF167 family protein [Aestuariispira ectoiniformans]|uniref:DUF167 family protein n=1 Tax=Aestuariispira ectoiniformans TaxID=2775080 RepID=UPI00223BEBCA|nr:DUF167 family protein [Aestuariispira ectoiniformans]